MNDDAKDSVISARHQLSGMRIFKSIFVSGLIVILITVFLVTQAGSFAGTLNYITGAPPEYIIFGILLVAGTYLAAALSYIALGSKKSIRLLPTVGVQTATGITSRILPAGLGSAGLYAVYLRHNGFKYSQATAIVAANNLLGIAGNTLLLVLVLSTAPLTDVRLRFPHISWNFVVLILSILLGLSIFIILKSNVRLVIKKFIRDTLHSLRVTLRPSTSSGLSLYYNMAITVLNGLILAVCVLSVGATMYWPLVLLVLSVGNLLGTALPTPGGVGGIEAGIVAGLVMCGVPAAPALAATILYRLLTYWLPVMPGLLMLPWLRKRYLN